MKAIPLAERAAGGLRAGRLRSAATPYLFLLPALLIYGVFLVYPMVDSLWLSLFDWDGLSPTRTFVGLDNYRRILIEDPVSRLALRNNVIWTFVKLTIPPALGLLLAIALNGRLPGRIIFRGIFYGPGVLPLVAVGMIWAWMYNPSFGVLNEFLKLIGLGELARGWLSDYSTALPATMVTSIWYGTGFPMILYLAGLQGIPSEQYEAARIDGAGPIDCFWHVTMPWLRESHVVVFSLAVISSFRVFDIVYTMTNGGPGRETQVLALWMYQNTFQYSHAGLGAALAWLIALISLGVTVPYIRLMASR